MVVLLLLLPVAVVMTIPVKVVSAAVEAG